MMACCGVGRKRRTALADIRPVLARRYFNVKGIVGIGGLATAIVSLLPFGGGKGSALDRGGYRWSGTFCYQYDGTYVWFQRYIGLGVTFAESEKVYKVMVPNRKFQRVSV